MCFSQDWFVLLTPTSFSRRYGLHAHEVLTWIIQTSPVEHTPVVDGFELLRYGHSGSRNPLHHV